MSPLIIPRPFRAIISGYYAAVMADSPISYWRFGETTGLIAIDEIGTIDGAYSSTLTLGVPSLISSESNTAVSLDGPTAVPKTTINVTGSEAVFNFIHETGVFSIETNINLSSMPTTTAIMGSAYSSSGSPGFFFGIRSSGAIYFFIDGGNVVIEDSNVGVINLNTTHHVVITSDGTIISFYVDGVQQGSANAGWSTKPTGDSPYFLYIGACNGWNGGLYWLEGTIDDTAIYNYTLTADQVLTHYNATV